MSAGSVAITGAFSYSGAYIAEAFLDAGWQLRTLTRNPDRPHRLQGQLDARPLNFGNAEEIQANLEGLDVLINTYWVRFDYRGSSFRQAIENSARLFSAANAAGVQRILHLSVSNPDPASELPYYAGKAEVERLLAQSGLPHSILRPTLIFGEEELLLNNIAWLLRKMPLFPIPRAGGYRVQPIYVCDLAQLALHEAQQEGNRVVNAAASEILSYYQLVKIVRDAVGSRALLVHVSPGTAIFLAKLLGPLLRDVLLTRDELDGLMQERLYVGDDCIDGAPFTDWARENAHLLGRSYTNEIRRHHQPQ